MSNENEPASYNSTLKAAAACCRMQGSTQLADAVLEIDAALAAQPAEQASAGSIGDDAEFERMVKNWPSEWVNLCAYIDSRPRQADQQAPSDTQAAGKLPDGARPDLAAAMADTDQVPYLIVFDDAARANETVIGGTRANYRFKEISASWNAHLFAKIASSSLDGRYASHNYAALAQQAPDTVREDDRRDADIATIRDLDRLGMQLGADLVNMHTDTIKGIDYLQRESVMRAVVAWRSAWNENSKKRKPIDRAALAATSQHQPEATK